MCKFDRKEVLRIGRNTIIQEANAISKLSDYIDESFVDTVELISKSKGRVIVTGIGKSANIGLKIVASLNSTGTPAIFMHAADAIHGDLGMVQQDDVVIFISKSGNTPEIKVLIPWIKRRGNATVAIVSDVDSFLGRSVDYVLRASVSSEACPNNLAPTSSTTAQLVVGDALTVALLETKNFTSQDFAKHHPGGALGKKLYLRVSDIYTLNQSPKVLPTDNIKTVISEITSKRLGATAVVDENSKLLGIITDGDLRRMLEKNEIISSDLCASDIMSANPRIVAKDELAVTALEIIRNANITQIIVCENDEYLGFVHLHDLIREGIV